MLSHFIHNNELVPVEDWKKLIPFYSPQYLMMALDEREYDGRISVTQCLRCPREVVFRLLFDYAIDPQDMAFMIVGTKAHAKLESLDSKEKDMFTEIELSVKLNNIMVKGIADLIFKENDKWTLADNKTWGSFALVKNFGIVSAKRPMIDENGNAVLYKNSRSGHYQKGQPRQETYFYEDPDQAEDFDITMQTNMYRYMWEQSTGNIIDKLRVYVIVRDGGLQVATGRGVFYKTYAKDLKILDDTYIKEFFFKRADYLINTINKLSFANKQEVLDDPPVHGTDQETMGGRICTNSCPVAGFCNICKEHPKKAEYSKFVLDPLLKEHFTL